MIVIFMLFVGHLLSLQSYPHYNLFCTIRADPLVNCTSLLYSLLCCTHYYSFQSPV